MMGRKLFPSFCNFFLSFSADSFWCLFKICPPRLSVHPLVCTLLETGISLYSLKHLKTVLYWIGVMKWFFLAMERSLHAVQLSSVVFQTLLSYPVHSFFQRIHQIAEFLLFLTDLVCFFSVMMASVPCINNWEYQVKVKLPNASSTPGINCRPFLNHVASSWVKRSSPHLTTKTAFL